MGQLLQVVEPATAYCPLGQALHAAALYVVLIEPCGHCSHCSDDASNRLADEASRRRLPDDGKHSLKPVAWIDPSVWWVNVVTPAGKSIVAGKKLSEVPAMPQ
jgi:hypothetical protein